MATATTWQGFAASAIGKAHIDSGLPNQDAIFLQHEPDYTVAVVSDGAGSARFSQQGSQYFSQAVGELLLKLAVEFGENLIKKSNSQTMLLLGLNGVRQQLGKQLAADDTLRDYHATVTAVLLFHHSQQALLVQIGDSPLLTSRFVVDTQSVPNNVDYFTDVALKGDDSKNEYVNETHFITQDNWQDFLRIEWLDVGAVDCIALMSDGCADLVLQGATTPPKIYRPFFGNLLFNLCAIPSAAQGNTVIENALTNPGTYRLTGDDKSLIVLLKNPKQYQGFEPVLEHPTIEEPIEAIANSANNVWHGATPTQPTTTTHTNLTPSLTTNPNHAPLPPSTAMTDSGKQRRNVSLAAGLVVLVGAGALAWINQDKILAITNQYAQPAVTTVTATPASLPPVSLSPASQAFALSDKLVLTNVSDKFFIQTLIANPFPTSKTNVAKSKAKLTATANTIVPMTGVLQANWVRPTGQQPIMLSYQATCEPVMGDALTRYRDLGIEIATSATTASGAQQPLMSYQYCRIEMQPVADSSTVSMNASMAASTPVGVGASSILPATVPDTTQLLTSRIILPQGITAIMSAHMTTTPQAASQTGQTVNSQSSDSVAPSVYYLPDDFSSTSVIIDPTLPASAPKA